MMFLRQREFFVSNLTCFPLIVATQSISYDYLFFFEIGSIEMSVCRTLDFVLIVYALVPICSIILSIDHSMVNTIEKQVV